METRQQKMLNDLRALGVKSTDSLLMHSSFKSLGGIEGGPTGALEVLEAAVCDGTLMLPTLSYAHVTAEHPIYDIKNTPACIGILPETFRKMPGVYRSGSPTHSVGVWGKDAEEIVSKHILDDTPVGPNSPFSILRDRGGKLLMLGCGVHSCTTMHGVEELIMPEFLFFKSVEYTVILEDGTETKVTTKRHGFNHFGYAQCYHRIMDLLDPSEYTHGYVLDAECWLIDSRAVWKRGEDMMRKNKYYFVDKIDPIE